MVRAVRGAASGATSVVRRPDHVQVLAALPGEEERGPGARCEGCGGDVSIRDLDRGIAGRVLGEFFRRHRDCRRPPATPEKRRPEPALPPRLDPEALRRRGQELLEEARRRARR